MWRRDRCAAEERLTRFLLGDASEPEQSPEAVTLARTQRHVRAITPQLAVALMRAPLRWWRTSHRMHDAVRGGCLFGCAAEADRLEHCVRCVDFGMSIADFYGIGGSSDVTSRSAGVWILLTTLAYHAVRAARRPAEPWTGAQRSAGRRGGNRAKGAGGLATSAPSSRSPRTSMAGWLLADPPPALNTLSLKRTPAAQVGAGLSPYGGRGQHLAYCLITWILACCGSPRMLAHHCRSTAALALALRGLVRCCHGMLGTRKALGMYGVHPPTTIPGRHRVATGSTSDHRLLLPARCWPPAPGRPRHAACYWPRMTDRLQVAARSWPPPVVAAYCG